MKQLSDEQLIKMYLQGEESALRHLIERYLKIIYNFIYYYVKNKSDAEDITQEVFLSVWKNIKKFNQEKKFKTWIFVIAKNASLNYIKKKKPSLLSDFEKEDGENDLLNSLADPSPLPDELLSRVDFSKSLNNALDKLNPKQKVVISLRLDNQLTFQEISDYLGQSLNTVKSKYRRALMVLKKYFDEIN